MSSTVNSVASYCPLSSTSYSPTPYELRKADLQKKRKAFKSQVQNLRQGLESGLVLLNESRTEQSSVLKNFKSKITPIKNPHELFKTQIVGLTRKIDSWASEDEEVAEALLNRAEILLDLGREEEALADYKEVKKMYPECDEADSGIDKCNRHLHPMKPPSVPETSIEKT